MMKLAEHSMPRHIALAYAIIFGSFTGIYTTIYSPIRFTLNPELLFWVAAAISSIILLHEAIHGLVAALLGIKPIFGHNFPTVYVTFEKKMPRNHFLLIAVAPFFILNAAFILIFASGFNKIYCYFSLILNTAGSFGDLWIAIKLIGYKKGTVVQDLKTGFEVWQTRQPISADRL